MVIRGRVKNGVVVLENGPALAEGAVVEVRPVAAGEDKPGVTHVSPEQREAILGLIGIWKTSNPPSDEEVEQIIYEEIMRKHS